MCSVSIKVEDPQFEGQTKAKLGTSEAKNAVEGVLSEYLNYYLEENPNIAKTIIEKGMMASRARDAARKARCVPPSGVLILLTNVNMLSV